MIESIENEINAGKDGQSPIVPDTAIGRLSRLEAMQAAGVAERSLNTKKARLGRLKEALKRVDSDEDFGLCTECEEPIPMKRLRLVPEAVICIQCMNER